MATTFTRAVAPRTRRNLRKYGVKPVWLCWYAHTITGVPLTLIAVPDSMITTTNAAQAAVQAWDDFKATAAAHGLTIDEALTALGMGTLA